MTCPCNAALATGPYTCLACKRKAQANPGVNTAGGVKVRSAQLQTQTDSVRGMSVASMQGERVIRAYQGLCLPDTRHIRFDPSTNAAAFMRVAVHESAHAVVAAVLGVRVEGIHPGPLNGYVQHVAPDNPRAELAIDLAGWAGEHLVILPEHAPARPLGGQDAIDAERCLDELGLVGDARRTAIDRVADLVRRCLIAHAEAWDALLWRLVQAPMQVLDGATARKIMSTGEPMATAA